MPITEEAVRRIWDQKTLLEFFERELHWPLPDDPVIDDVTFEWTAADLRLSANAQQRLAHGSIKQLRPMVDGQPWGIFLINFTDGQVYRSALRQVLRGLVPKRRRDAKLPGWQHENLLFICMTANQEFTFAHFRGETPERAKLVRFSWSPEEPLRTLLEFNLPALQWPAEDLIGISPTIWLQEWSKAFDVEKVTVQFFSDYCLVFDRLQKLLRCQVKDKKWAHDYALHFLNRVLFLYFIQKKKWLGGDSRFMKSLWDSYKSLGKKKDTFFSEWISVLFFEAFNNKYQNREQYLKRFPENIHKAFAGAPYLNGGLFSETSLDTDHTFTIADEFFLLLFDNFKDYRSGFLERYNFTITEDTPLDQEVAVDPEMIGKVYESLVNITFEGITEEDLRGQAGIFYTPRVEIDLMCRLSLIDWLSNHLGRDSKRFLRRAIFAYSPEEKRDADEEISRANLWPLFNTQLRSVTLLDPACGSGSFLIGMLLVLDDLQERANRVLGIHETAYERRRRIIGQSLYGVDVMDWAVHVAELRLWLQIVVETELAPAELKFRPLLPNLSFKVRCGDSLVQEIGGVNFGLHRSHLHLSPSVQGKLTSLKGEKLNYFQGEYKDTAATRIRIEKEELNLFSLILREKEVELDKQIKKLTEKIANPDEGEQLVLIETGRSPAKQLKLIAEEWERQLEQLKQEQSRMRIASRALSTTKELPFVWDVAFVEVFEGDKAGFDIVIGNPPYVRQEKLANPRLDPSDLGGESSEQWKEMKFQYKAKLQRSMYEAFPGFFGYKPLKGTVARMVDGKCDLYIFFYFHGLSLLNAKGSFCFITSNSWLDVGYGADLQEFLLKHCAIKFIIDNEHKRSFAHADINTVICLFSAPAEQSESVFENIARFVMAKVPFERFLSPVVFEAIEEAGVGRLRHAEYRLVANRQNLLFQEGLATDEEVDDKATAIRTKEYVGDKWGGKYLRAPDIFFTILEKGKDKIVRLGDIAKVSFGIKTGANEFFYLDKEGIAQWGVEDEFLRPVIKSPRESDAIFIDPNKLKFKLFTCGKKKSELRGTMALRYINWGESQGFQMRPTCHSRGLWYSIPWKEPASVLYPMIHNERPIAFWNGDSVAVDHNLFEIHTDYPAEICACLCSTIQVLFRELFGRANLGEGALKTEGMDIKKFPILNPVSLPSSTKQILERSLHSLWKRPILNLEDEIKQKDRQALDQIIFNHLGLTKVEQKEVYIKTVSIVSDRLNKAQSINK